MVVLAFLLMAFVHPQMGHAWMQVGISHQMHVQKKQWQMVLLISGWPAWMMFSTCWGWHWCWTWKKLQKEISWCWSKHLHQDTTLQMKIFIVHFVVDYLAKINAMGLTLRWFWFWYMPYTWTKNQDADNLSENPACDHELTKAWASHESKRRVPEPV